MNISIFGAGAWGTAVAHYCNEIGNVVTLLPKFEDQAEKITKYRENVDFLPRIKLSEKIKITTDIADGIKDIDLAFLAYPSIGFEGLCRELQEESKKHSNLPILISLCKGIQNENCETACDLLKRFVPNFEHGVLAGPTNAREVAESRYAAMVLATKSKKVFELQKSLTSDKIRIYSSTDVKGAELGGCLKNVYAIGAGICDGLELGSNAKAAYLTRSFKELISVGMALGGHKETFYGLSGFGDLIATCTGEWSRNRTFGEKIGRGEKVSEILSAQTASVEGYKTSQSFFIICEKAGLEVPIISAIHSVLYRNFSLRDCVNMLLSRSLKPES